jgi:hypothetical protein
MTSALKNPLSKMLSEKETQELAKENLGVRDQIRMRLDYKVQTYNRTVQILLSKQPLFRYFFASNSP